MPAELTPSSGSSTVRPFQLTAAKLSDIQTRVLYNPEIPSSYSNYLDDLIQRSARVLAAWCSLPRYPQLMQGFSKSKLGAETDISGISTNNFNLSVNGSSWKEIEITLANCTTGVLTAAEMQTQIRADDDDDGFGEVTVSFAGADGTAQYTITSGRYGEGSKILVDFDETDKHVCQNLLLSPLYGGVEEVGGVDDTLMDDALVWLVEHMYRKIGIEGVKEGRIPGDMEFVEYKTSPVVSAVIRDRARMW